jgi:hypothetical protein
LADPCGLPLYAQWSLAATVLEPGPSAIVMVSVVAGPWNVMSRDAASTPLITTDSCAVAVTFGKFQYTNSTSVHEMLIVLVCADAAVEINTKPTAVSTSCAPTPVTTTAASRCWRRVRPRTCCS